MTCLMAVRDADTFYGGAGSDLIFADSTDTLINGWLYCGWIPTLMRVADNAGPDRSIYDDAWILTGDGNESLGC